MWGPQKLTILSLNSQTLSVHIYTLVNTLIQTPTAANTHERTNMRINIRLYPPDAHTHAEFYYCVRVLGSFKQNEIKTL